MRERESNGESAKRERARTETARKESAMERGMERGRWRELKEEGSNKRVAPIEARFFVRMRVFPMRRSYKALL